MLTKLLANSHLSRAAPLMGSAARRGVYTNETRPYVFINQHTRVICQGMTGKHVSFFQLTDKKKDLSLESSQILVALFRSPKLDELIFYSFTGYFPH